MGGKEIKEAREKAGLTQEELAFRTNLHRTYISMIERNVNSLTLPTLFRICEALSIRPSTLVARIEKSNPTNPKG
jgi:transcriptional regulator with XRE-family HTH domain